jgi:hypothetical protein
MDSMESCEAFFQRTHAKVAHSKLHAIARASITYPNGRETIKNAGTKMNATASKATVVVYCVPVDFCWGAIMTNLLGCYGEPKKRNQSAGLSSDDLRIGGSAQTLTIVG